MPAMHLKLESDNTYQVASVCVLNVCVYSHVFSAICIKANNFRDLLFASQESVALVERVLLLKERICCCRFDCHRIKMAELLPLKVEGI